VYRYSSVSSSKRADRYSEQASVVGRALRPATQAAVQLDVPSGWLEQSLVVEAAAWVRVMMLVVSAEYRPSSCMAEVQYS